MVEEHQIPSELHAELFERRIDGLTGLRYEMLHSYGLPEGQFMTIYPVPGQDNDVRRGRRRSNFVWYHPMREDDLSPGCAPMRCLAIRRLSRDRMSAWARPRQRSTRVI